MNFINGIALDGPAGAGKSTIAKIIAKRLGLPYLDTGAMYRAMALCAFSEGVSLTDAEKVDELLNRTDIRVAYLDDGQHVFVNGTDVTGRLREEEIGKGASLISKLRCVRDKLAGMQRDIAHETHAVLDGREIGTFVIPETPYKFYVTATAEERALRRVRQLEEKGEKPDYELILKDIEARDYQDSHRDYAPLKQAEDAVLIDTTHMTIDEAVDAVLKTLEEKTA
ncbi:MAG: (d)CMP kinase [Clostridia bacterium]|nr:(d)CMP kinase [Clostridia bacterium]